jgi:hypothetical protein
MSSCFFTPAEKDSNAQYSTRIYSSSDVTRMIRDQSIRNNYVQLNAKNFTVPGGVSHEDLYAISHTVGSYAAASSLTSTSYGQCVGCPGVPFQPAAAANVIHDISNSS